MTRAIWWLRRDLRLDDNPALQAAMRVGAVIPVYIHAPDEEAPWAPGGASRAWLRRSLQALDAELRARGSALVHRAGPSAKALDSLLQETGAGAVFWNRLYEPACIERDTAIKLGLRQRGIAVETFNAALLFEPWTVQTQAGEPYRVFTPFWRNANARREQLPSPEPAPARIPNPALPPSQPLDALLPPPWPRWDTEFWEHWSPGEAGASDRLGSFLDSAVSGYRTERDRPDRAATSKLSPHLHFGEISPRRILAQLDARRWSPAQHEDVAHFIRELGWREFSHHLLYHFPDSTDANLNPRFDHFAWSREDPVAIEAWRRGRTGVPLVDAGMRELWHTGWMHNRVRMIVASWLTKNLRQHWLHGARWFWDTLVDADLANNTQGWQWTAGTGADASPYFRVFNPVSQAERFDPQSGYIRRWLPELARLPDAALHAPWEHPDFARTAPSYPQRPMRDLRASRAEALEAYQAMKDRD